MCLAKKSKDGHREHVSSRARNWIVLFLEGSTPVSGQDVVKRSGKVTQGSIPLGDAIVASLHHFIPALTTSHYNCLLTCTVLPTGLSSLKKQLVTHLCILSSYHPTATRQSNYIRMFQEMYLYPNITWPILSEQRRLWSLDHFAPTAIPSQNQNHVKIYYFINPSEIFRAWKKSSLCRAQEKSSLYLKIVKW